MDNVVKSSPESIEAARIEFERLAREWEAAVWANDLTVAQLSDLEKRVEDAHDSYSELRYHVQ